MYKFLNLYLLIYFLIFFDVGFFDVVLVRFLNFMVNIKLKLRLEVGKLGVMCICNVSICVVGVGGLEFRGYS